MPNDWPFVWESTDDRWIPITQGQWCGKRFHCTTSSCKSHGVLNHWQLGCLLNSLAREFVTILLKQNHGSWEHAPVSEGMHRWWLDSHHKGTVMRERFWCMTSSWEHRWNKIRYPKNQKWNNCTYHITKIWYLALQWRHIYRRLPSQIPCNLAVCAAVFQAFTAQLQITIAICEGIGIPSQTVSNVKNISIS